MKRAVTVNARTAKHNMTDMPLTKLIIAINLVVFVYTDLIKSKTVTGEKLGLFAPFVANGEWWRIVTSGFLHFGFFHVGMNMNMGAEEGLIPAKLSESIRAIVTAGLANDVDEVNQYAPPIHAPTAYGTDAPRPERTTP